MSRKEILRQIIGLLGDVGTELACDRVVSRVELYTDMYDIHAFYQLFKPAWTIHVQVYPGFSSEEYVRIWARAMDTAKLRAIRKHNGISIGNEHEAVVLHFPNFREGIDCKYKPNHLIKKLLENIPLERRNA